MKFNTMNIINEIKNAVNTDRVFNSKILVQQ